LIQPEEEEEEEKEEQPRRHYNGFVVKQRKINQAQV
jgi:hypothetical protein